LEVQGRAGHAPGALTSALEWAWPRRFAAVALAVGVGLAAVVVTAQPVGSPWWTYADADASYTGAALNLVAGYRAQFVDHPGLPLTEATALLFGADALARGAGSRDARERYVDERLLDLDRTRTIFRGFAIALYLAGSLLAFLALARLLGHWTWGLAGSLLWLAVPGLEPMSIQLRPDVALAFCCLGFAYLVGVGVQARDARLYAGAAALAGFALLVKLHAVGLVVPLAAAVLWRPPERSWRPPARTVAWSAAALVSFSLVVNWERLPFTPTAAQGLALAVVLAATALASAVARLRKAVAVPLAYAAGVLVPVLLDPPDGLQALVVLGNSAVGRGVSDVPSFQTPLEELRGFVGLGALLVFALAALAAAFGFRRRDPRPVVWASGALVLGILAWARPVTPHYLAPSFVVAVPAALWLLQRTPRARATLLLWPLVVWIAWPSLRDRDAPAQAAEALAAEAAPVRMRALAELDRGEVALTPSYWPDGDVRYFELVQLYVEHSPPYPYRLLPDTAAARRYAHEHGFRIAGRIR
jgi:dolichyl-phosphate-mannose-protein mannosyltransferase